MTTGKNDSQTRSTRLPSILQWTGRGRTLVFCLSGTSIACLLSEMYGWCDMRVFLLLILLPAFIALYGIALLDRFLGNRMLFRAVMLGTFAGIFGAIAYDVFRLPFVYSDALGLSALGIPQMPLFKVFPQFGAMILGEPAVQDSYSFKAHALGWIYHFSNGAAFGIMFVALYAGAREAIGAVRNSSLKPIMWAVLMAVGIELALLASPYAKFFDIEMTMRFVAVTMLAHLIFGLGMGAYYAWHANRWRLVTA